MPNEIAEKPYRSVVFDIENSPNIGFTWGKYEQNVLAFEQEWFMMSFAWKWSDEKTTHVLALPDFPNYKKDPTDDSALVGELWKILDEADLAIGHNIVEFDRRKANSRFLYHGMQPPSPYKMVDTLKLARALFMLNSNKLGDLAQYLGIGAKKETGGINLWLECLRGDPKAWAKMKAYNKHDVVINAQIYEILRGWDNYHPNVTLGHNPDSSLLCPSCGSNKVQARGYQALKSFRARRYHCQNCGRWSKGKRERIQGIVLN